MMAVPENIYEKLRKCKALADQATSPGEAEAAARAFHRLMAKHNLSMELWEIEAGRSQSSVVKFDYKVKSTSVWRAHLLHVASKANYCKAIAGYDGRHYIFGTPRNVKATTELYEWLSDVVDKVAASYKAPPGENVKAFRNAFRHGMVTGIRSALSQESNEIRQRNPSLSAVVPVLIDEAEAEARKTFPRLTKLKADVDGSTRAYMLGVDEGKRVRRRVDQLTP